MQFKLPQNSDKYQWTQHSIFKMKQHGLTPQRVKRVIRSPQRTEKGIVKDTIAVMQPTSTRRNKEGKQTWKSEVWVMYQLKKKKLTSDNEFNFLGDQLLIKIISAWRYPGVSSKKDPIPEEILNEVENIL